MGIMTRILRLWKADIHGVMDQLEDKELLLKQYLREMENDLQKKEGRVQQLADASRKINNDLCTRRQEIDKLEKDLMLALRKENDEIAKTLIRKQRIELKHCEHLQQQCKILTEEKEQLSELLDEQRLQYASLKAKAATYRCQGQNNSFTEADTIFSEASNAFTVGEDEIDLELMRRKETFQKEGGAA